MLDIKKIVKKLTLYESDLYGKNIVVIPQEKVFKIKNFENKIIQTDASCWKKEADSIIFMNYKYVLIRTFDKQKIVKNEIYYDVDSFEHSELEISELFPIFPNKKVLNYYLNYCNISSKTKQKCLNYGKNVNKQFYK